MRVAEGLDIASALWLLENYSSPLVKVSPRFRGGHAVWGRGVLKSVNQLRETAMIQPFGHKRLEEVELRFLKKWSSKNEALEPQVKRDPQSPLVASLGDLLNKNNIKMQKEELSVVPIQEEKKLGRPVRTYTEEQYTQYIKLREMGKSGPDCEIIMGLPKSIISNMNAKLWYQQTLGRAKNPQVRKVSAPEVLSPEPAQAATKPEVPVEVKPVQSVVKEFIPMPPKIDLVSTIHQILSLNISDTQKLLAIDALVRG